VRWSAGVGWTEHLSMPEPEPEVEVNPYLVPRVAEEVDDGLLHPRSRELVFSDAPRGSVSSLAERSKITTDSLTSLRGMQVAGAAAFTLMCAFIAVHGVLGDGGLIPGVCAGLAVLVPFFTRAIIQVQLRNEFWWHWCATRGFDPAFGKDPGKLLPANLNRSPLIGSMETRVIEFAARRRLCRREAVVGRLLRIMPPAEDIDPLTTPTYYRAMYVVMPMPEIAAARWVGASIRADHQAQRPLSLRAMLGALAPSGIADATSHLSIAEGQDPHLVQRVVDARLEQYLKEHPIDVDIVGDLLVVTQDGSPGEADPLDELCRSALLLHELLVAEHEVPEVDDELEPVSAVAHPDDDQPVVDMSRGGWGEQLQELNVSQVESQQHVPGMEQQPGYEQQPSAEQQTYEQQAYDQQAYQQQLYEQQVYQQQLYQQQLYEQQMQQQAYQQQQVSDPQAYQQQGWDDGSGQMAA
jgi:hypothetical protein